MSNGRRIGDCCKHGYTKSVCTTCRIDELEAENARLREIDAEVCGVLLDINEENAAIWDENERLREAVAEKVDQVMKEIKVALKSCLFSTSIVMTVEEIIRRVFASPPASGPGPSADTARSK